MVAAEEEETWKVRWEKGSKGYRPVPPEGTVCSFRKYSLSTFCAPGTVVGTGSRSSFCHSPWKGRKNNREMNTRHTGQVLGCGEREGGKALELRAK